jgi:hypothetical protein
MGKRQRQLDAIIKILMMVLCLVAILALRHACANGMVNLFNTVAPAPAETHDGGPPGPPGPPGTSSSAPSPR